MTDPTFDFGLCDYIFEGKLPNVVDEAERITKEAKLYKRRGDDLMRKLDNYPGMRGKFRYCCVPPITQRERIVRDTHESLSHIGRDKLISSISSTWWWPKIRDTVEHVLTTCPACQADRLPRPPANLSGQQSGLRMWGGWSIDLAGPFPKDPYNNTYLAVAIDTLSKWPEAHPIRSKHAYRTATWFYNEILARWSKP